MRVRVQPRRKCPKGHGELVLDVEGLAQRTFTDLAFTRNGCHKTVTRYEGRKARCLTCGKSYEPPALRRLGNKEFGHAFQAWTICQRVVLRLPYQIITQVTEHLFGIGLSPSTGVNFLRYLANYYAPTEAASLQAILKSDFVHVDETKINIQGVDHYVWLFTDGQHVVFRMTETRETDIVREILAGYQGVLVSDFYPGYDSMLCLQQKCLVHLIRNINDERWKAPLGRKDRNRRSQLTRDNRFLVPRTRVILLRIYQRGHIENASTTVLPFHHLSTAATWNPSPRSRPGKVQKPSRQPDLPVCRLGSKLLPR